MRSVGLFLSIQYTEAEEDRASDSLPVCANLEKTVLGLEAQCNEIIV